MRKKAAYQGKMIHEQLEDSSNGSDTDDYGQEVLKVFHRTGQEIYQDYLRNNNIKPILNDCCQGALSMLVQCLIPIQKIAFMLLVDLEMQCHKDQQQLQVCRVMKQVWKQNSRKQLDVLKDHQVIKINAKPLRN